MCYWWSRKPNLMTRKLPPCYQEHVTKNCRKIGGGGGGGGVGSVTRQSFIRGGTAPRSNPLPFYIPFSAKKVPFSSVPSTDRWCPFHNTPVQNFGYIHSLESEWITKPGNFLDFITAINYPSVSHFGPFCKPKWQISRPFHKLQLVKFLPLNFVIFLKPKKSAPFGDGASRRFRPL